MLALVRFNIYGAKNISGTIMSIFENKAYIHCYFI